MKKLTLLLLILLIFCCNNSFASIELERTTYSTNEIILFYLYEQDFQEIELELFKDDTKMTINPISEKIEEGKFLVYFQARPVYGEGNFSLIYQNNYIQEFKIIQDNISLSLRPPYKKLSPNENSFSIILRNEGIERFDISISSEDKYIQPVRPVINLLPGESKNLFVNYDFQKITDNTYINLLYSNKTYKIPIIIKKDLPDETLPEEEIEEIDTKDYSEAIILLTDIDKIKHEIFTDQIIEGSLSFKNTLNQNLNNITFSFSPELAPIIDLDKYHIPTVLPNQEFTIDITINKFKNINPGTYKGAMSVTCEEGCFQTLLFDLNFRRYVEITLDEPVEEITEINETGDDLDIVFFNFTEPETPEKDDSGNLGIAIILILIVLAGIIFITYKLKPIPIEPGFKNIKKKKN